jgi:hypothetical protein
MDRQHPGLTIDVSVVRVPDGSQQCSVEETVSIPWYSVIGIHVIREEKKMLWEKRKKFSPISYRYVS